MTSISAQPAKIQDYAIIGNRRSAALISKGGSLDWLCWPRFDSPSIFGALLDRKIGGYWSIQAAEESRVSRQYIENTNVLQTVFTTGSGKLVLTDFMPVTSEEEKGARLWPENEIIRRINCEEGNNSVLIEFYPRPDYGRGEPSITNEGKLGWRINVGKDLLTLRSDIDLTPDSRGGLRAELRLRRSESLAFSLTYSEEAPAVLPPLANLVEQKLKLSADWWQRWAARANYHGPYREHVIRSALVMALLSFAPSGALIAAPTTSLPEQIGGDLNWDYRFCWLRDAALAVRALSSLGYDSDAGAFLSWLLHTTRLTRPRLKPLYDVYGNDSPGEQTLSYLSGYANSRPVRLGNAAADQLQLDVYGEVIDAVSHFISHKKDLDRDTQKMLCSYGEYVCRKWREPDDGIWEQRGAPKLYTQSRVLCWVALDRLIDLQRRGLIKSLPLEKVRRNRDQIRSEIEQHAWSEKLQAYTQTFDGEAVDASALLLVLYGFEDAKSHRMQQTHLRLREELCPGIGLMYRDNRSETKKEGCFGMCAFWEANFLAHSGDLDGAHRVFESVLAYANDVGLFSEEIDPETGDALGNFPQALTHLALISAALELCGT